MDWGSASPFSVGWWAIVQDDHALANGGIVLPRGCMVRYREWYGMRPGEPNVGLKLHAEEVGKGIAEREQGESIAYGVLDPSAFKEDGGPSIAERIARGSGGKVWFRHADNTRVPARGAMGGWDQVRSRLGGRRRRATDDCDVCDLHGLYPHRPDPAARPGSARRRHDRQRGPCWRRMALCLHVATVGADERGADAGEHQRLPALPDGRAAGGLVDVLSFLSGQIGFSLQGMTWLPCAVSEAGRPTRAVQF